MTARERATEVFPERVCDCQELSGLHGHPVKCLLCRMEAAIAAHAEAVREEAAEIAGYEMRGGGVHQTEVARKIRAIEVK